MEIIEKIRHDLQQFLEEIGPCGGNYQVRNFSLSSQDQFLWKALTLPDLESNDLMSLIHWLDEFIGTSLSLSAGLLRDFIIATQPIGSDLGLLLEDYHKAVLVENPRYEGSENIIRGVIKERLGGDTGYIAYIERRGVSPIYRLCSLSTYREQCSYLPPLAAINIRLEDLRYIREGINYVELVFIREPEVTYYGNGVWRRINN